MRSIMAFCTSPMLNRIEAYIEYAPDLVADDGTVTSDSTREFLATDMREVHGPIAHVYTALPRPGA